MRFEDSVEVEGAEGESEPFIEGGDGRSNFLRLDGVTGADVVEPVDPEVSSEGADALEEILNAAASTLTRRIPVGLSSRHNP
jgi:hypothetical protein